MKKRISFLKISPLAAETKREDKGRDCPYTWRHTASHLPGVSECLSDTLYNTLKSIDIFVGFKPRKIDGTAHSPGNSKKTAYRGNMEDLEKRREKVTQDELKPWGSPDVF